MASGCAAKSRSRPRTPPRQGEDACVWSPGEIATVVSATVSAIALLTASYIGVRSMRAAEQSARASNRAAAATERALVATLAPNFGFIIEHHPEHWAPGVFQLAVHMESGPAVSADIR